MQQKTIYFLALLWFALGLVGCSRHDFTVTELPPIKNSLNAELKDINITYQQQEEDRPTIRIQESCFSEEELTTYIDLAWAVALKDAFKRANLFDKSSAKKIDLHVNILEVQIPFIGTDATTSVSANYKIIDRATDKAIYDETLTTEATVPFSYAFIGAVRANESLNRSVQKNILTFINHLKAIRTL
jgi:hypothetical protein